MVIGTFAYCGSGQDTLADGFCRYKGFQKFSMGDIIRNIAKERGLPPKRENLQKIREECDAVYGRDFTPKQIVSQICLTENQNIIITGIRTMEEYLYFKSQLNMILVFVFADEKIRFLRMLKRAEEKDEANLLELKKRMDREEELFDYEQLRQRADITFVFNMNLSQYLDEEQTIVDSLFRSITEL